MRGKIFVIIFLIVYGLSGLSSAIAVRISWVETADIWDKFKEYLRIAVLERMVSKIAFSFTAAMIIYIIISIFRHVRKK